MCRFCETRHQPLASPGHTSQRRRSFGRPEDASLARRPSSAQAPPADTQRVELHQDLDALLKSLLHSFVERLFGRAAPDFATNNARHTRASLRTCRSPADQTTGCSRRAPNAEHVFHASAAAARSRGARNAASFDHPRGLSEGTSTSAARPKPSRGAQSSICSRGGAAAVVAARPEQRALVAVRLLVEPGHDTLDALGRVAVRGPLGAAAGARLERRRSLAEGRASRTRERTDPGVGDEPAPVRRVLHEARVLEAVRARRAPQELRRGRRRKRRRFPEPTRRETRRSRRRGRARTGPGVDLHLV